jgi:hypothetical protein
MFVPVSYRGFVISSGFAWVVVSLPTTAYAKRGGTIPMRVPSVCTVVVHAVKRRGFRRVLRASSLASQLLQVVGVHPVLAGDGLPAKRPAKAPQVPSKKKGLENDLQALKR